MDGNLRCERALGNLGLQAVRPEGKAVRPSELGQDCSFQGILGLDSCVPGQKEGPDLQPLFLWDQMKPNLGFEPARLVNCLRTPDP